ncbi:hypothetical protein CRE_31022 [Caenorhabditis remanei]|uniref:G-protein coupled receptors family 1 profile domain-containing protein n=1 Tax=Caenorhabditis remanei TaxID=31234 RepID=E3LU61_CAERE|nr:hypothetical protein CRE_31022 [Caenorhabditis remanei]
MFITVFFFFILQTSVLSDNEVKILALTAEVPPNDKGSIYYLVISLFVMSVFASTLLTGAFLGILILLWGHFKTFKYFWFLSQLTIFVFILSALNLIINVPATLFSLITIDFVSSDIFTILSYTIDYLHYTILISNLVIALQRFSVFFFRQLTYRVFDSYVIYIWLLMIWILPCSIMFVMVRNNCRYLYMLSPRKVNGHYNLYCPTQNSLVDTAPPELVRIIELTLQFGIPVFILAMYVSIIMKIITMKKASLNRHETRVLIQAIIIFVLFQASSVVFLYCQTFDFTVPTAFLIKRIINTLEIMAGAATPCFSFFTSKEIRKMLSAKIASYSSQGSSHVVVRKPTLVEVES